MAAKAVAGMKIRWAFARVGSIPTARTIPLHEPKQPPNWDLDRV